MQAKVATSGSADATLQALKITPDKPTLTVGASQQMSATGTYRDGSTKDLTKEAIIKLDDGVSFLTIAKRGGRAGLRHQILWWGSLLGKPGTGKTDLAQAIGV